MWPSMSFDAKMAFARSLNDCLTPLLDLYAYETLPPREEEEGGAAAA